jgi:hypothetical protein
MIAGAGEARAFMMPPGRTGPMANPRQVYFVIEWQEQGPLDATGRRQWRKARKVCTIEDYPRVLPCHNLDCEEGGFDIGDRIVALLASGEKNEQNSLICHNAIHKDPSKRCLHIIAYSIACIRPYQRQKPR